MRILSILIAFFATSCSGDLGTWLDTSTFHSFGSTLFSDPQQVSLKEVHLDAGQLVGKTVVIEGNVVSVGKCQTHLVLADSTARMLVVLTKIHGETERYEKKAPKFVKVLGVVERGKKGLPYISALAISEMPVPNA